MIAPFTKRNMALRHLGLILLIFGVCKTTTTVDAFRPSLGHHLRVAVLSQNRRAAASGDRYSSSFDTGICQNGPTVSTTSLSCGLLEAIQNALGGGGSTATKATASHILLKEKTSQSKQKLMDLKTDIQDDPIKFGEAAATYSDCSSASKGGDLGEFGKGVMAKEFEKVVFDQQTPIGIVQGPIETEFGYHLIIVKERS